MSTLGENIRRAREKAGLTQDELAQKLGYKTRSSIAKIENGTNDIPQSKIVSIANALNTTPSELMGWDDSDKENNTEKDVSKFFCTANLNEALDEMIKSQSENTGNPTNREQRRHWDKSENVKAFDETGEPLFIDDEVREIVDSLRTRPEMKILFSASKKATKEDILKTIKIIEALRNSENE